MYCERDIALIVVTHVPFEGSALCSTSALRASGQGCITTFQGHVRMTDVVYCSPLSLLELSEACHLESANKATSRNTGNPIVRCAISVAHR